MSQPLISVVIPAYNAGRYIAETVASALAQTHRPQEVIVVNDGSTDDTEARLAPFMDRIVYLPQPNSGVSAARNNGIAKARGEWVALLDADDLWHPQKNEVQLRAALEHEKRTGRLPGMVGSKLSAKMPEQLPPDPPVRQLSVRDFLCGTPTSPSGVLIRRSALEQVGPFDPDLCPSEDRDMFLRLTSAFDVLLVQSPCWWYRVHPEQASGKPLKMNRQKCRTIEKFLRTHPEHARFGRLAWAYAYLDAALSHDQMGSRNAAMGCLLRSLATYPWHLTSDANSHWRRPKIFARLLIRGAGLPAQPKT